MEKMLTIKGAQVNNLKNVNLEIPLRKVTCFSGPSGSGKSSLAFHTIYNESKRRFLNSFPNYLKFFSDRPAPVEVDEIFPVLPVFALPQINPIAGARSIVADSCHLSELFQSIFYNYGVEKCVDHGEELVQVKFSDLCKLHTDKYVESAKFQVFIGKENFLKFFKDSPFPSRSFNGVSRSFNDEDNYWEIFRFKKSSISQVDSKAQAYIKKGIELYLLDEENHFVSIPISKHKICPRCHKSGMNPIIPAKFSANNAIGACSNCRGFGFELIFDEEKLVNKALSINEGGILFLEYKPFKSVKLDFLKLMKKEKISLTNKIDKLPSRFWKILYDGKGNYCGFNELFKYLERKKYKVTTRIYTRARQKEVLCCKCNGSRISALAGEFELLNLGIKYKDLWNKSFEDLYVEFSKIKVKDELLKKTLDKLLLIFKSAIDIGLNHLKINRKLKSLSAGEYQRILLLKYFMFEGTDSLFIFDEPSLGLTDKESTQLLEKFKDLTRQGNTVIVIDHNELFHEGCDHLVEMGPGAGLYGGEILYEGKSKKRKKVKKEKFELSKRKEKIIKFENITLFEKEYKSAQFSLNCINLIKGASGAGKSSIYVHTIANYYSKMIHGETLTKYLGSFERVNNKHAFEEIIVVDSNLTRYTSRSTVGSMTGFNSVVRKHFSKLAISKSMNLVEGHFSSNSELGQCAKCEGRGVQVIEMQFLEDIVLTCEDCNGTKLRPLYGKISDGNMSAVEAFSSPCHDILRQIKLTPKFKRIYEYLKLLKLDYLSIERQVNTLSGGERQRLFLLSRLQKDISNSLLVFENLSFGLSLEEINSLGLFLRDLVSKNNTIILIDQNDHFLNYSHKIIEVN